jgi:hypothetical protein
MGDGRAALTPPKAFSYKEIVQETGVSWPDFIRGGIV